MSDAGNQYNAIIGPGSPLSGMGRRGLCVALGIALMAASYAAKASQFAFDIKPQPTDDVLLQLAETAEIQILFSPQATEHTQSSGLQGTHTVREALDATLAGTGLAYKFKSHDFVVVKSKHAGARGSSRVVSRNAAEDERRNGVELARLQQTSERTEDSEDDDEKAEVEDEEPVELTTQTVTGTRLTKGDPSARVLSYSAEEIARRGVSTLEEFFATLPWAFQSITSQTATDLFASGARDTDVFLGPLGLGTSTVNLRALGSGNTLVLVNGRRVAGAAGEHGNFANIVNVPLSAIERVDIQLDGASAIYGSDAIGGVVNFITKSRYQGMNATYREEFSSTDSDRKKLSAQGGYAWGSGSVTVTLSRDESQPINNRKIWTSSDFTDQYGPEFDLRSYTISQPGIVCESSEFYSNPGCDSAVLRNPTRISETYYQLPAGSGVNATEADFISAENVVWGPVESTLHYLMPTDYVHPHNGADSSTSSLTARAEQYFANSDLRVYAEVLFSKHSAYRDFPTQLVNFVVPASNAYNPFGREVVVNYWPIREYEEGRIQSSYTETENEQRNYNTGFSWKLGASHELEFNVTRSESTYSGVQTGTRYIRDRYDPTAEKFYAALESSDPDIALNLLGDGTAQSAAFEDLVTAFRGPSYSFTDVTAYESHIRGDLFRLWGGPVSYVTGGEVRTSAFYSEDERFTENGMERVARSSMLYGVARPEEKLKAYFVEFALPIVGEENSRPGLRSLILSLQARRDEYEFTGAAGGVDSYYSSGPGLFWQPNVGWVEGRKLNQTFEGTPDIVTKKKSANSPRIGLHYKPADSLIARVSWARSFKPPLISHQFDVAIPFDWNYYFFDYAHPEEPGRLVAVESFTRGYNPDLQSEFAERLAMGLQWTSEAIPGLRWTVDWSRVDFIDKIENSSSLLRYYPEIVSGNEDIVVRDAEGYPTLVIRQPMNLADKISEVLESAVEYEFETAMGAFTPRLTYTRVLQEHFTIIRGTERIDRVGTSAGSNKYTLAGRLTWARGNFGADLFVRHIPGYENNSAGVCPRAVGRCPNSWTDLPMLEVDSLTTVDLSVAYLFRNGLRVRVGGRNVLDQDLPTVWNTLPYDPVRWDARGRVFFAELTWEM